VKCLHRTV